ncbi:MAG TPA: DNA-formamidopyrimidine glycosylase family protein, partial [Candidatus Bathyarchaeia archaeon]|nr:DNA-formamidopyrimidine glycosylase family protein [Candidatus Bathyarchaeia archaeon]
MSIELPEAHILAKQMNKELRGKCVKSYDLQDYKKLQAIGMLNKNIKDFDQLVNTKVESVTSRGNVIRVKLDDGVNLILDPEYGGEIFYHRSGKAITKKFHLEVVFDDGTILTVRLTSMGVIQIMKDNDLTQSYVYRRDFNPGALSPIDEDFTLECFSNLLANNNRALKSVLVGKDAIVVGLSNSAFQ